MKKIIKGKLYDTDTAKKLGSDSSPVGPRDFSYWHEELYQKRTGEFFLYGEGGPMSRYSRSMGDNSWSGGEEIIPLTFGTAREWAEEHLSADEYGEIFGMPSEDDELVVLHIQIPAAIGAKLKMGAAEAGTTLRAYAEKLLTEALK